MSFFSVLNFIASLALILFLIKASFVDSLLQRGLPDLIMDYQTRYEQERDKNIELKRRISGLEKEPTEDFKLQTKQNAPSFDYSGDDIFKLINEHRRNSSVGELSLDSNLCYLASYRLSQLLDLGKLDAHKGFTEYDPANKYKYERVGEDLAYGYATAKEVVEAWEKSPGHNLILKDPANTLGCVAANQGFAVLISGRER